MTLFYFLFHAICDMYIFLHFYCYGMRSAMLQINEYDDDDYTYGRCGCNNMESNGQVCVNFKPECKLINTRFLVAVWKKIQGDDISTKLLLLLVSV